MYRTLENSIRDMAQKDTWEEVQMDESISFAPWFNKMTGRYSIIDKTSGKVIAHTGLRNPEHAKELAKQHHKRWKASGMLGEDMALDSVGNGENAGGQLAPLPIPKVTRKYKVHKIQESYSSYYKQLKANGINRCPGKGCKQMMVADRKELERKDHDTSNLNDDAGLCGYCGKLVCSEHRTEDRSGACTTCFKKHNLKESKDFNLAKYHLTTKGFSHADTKNGLGGFVGHRFDNSSGQRIKLTEKAGEVQNWEHLSEKGVPIGSDHGWHSLKNHLTEAVAKSRSKVLDFDKQIDKEQKDTTQPINNPVNPNIAASSIFKPLELKGEVAPKGPHKSSAGDVQSADRKRIKVRTPSGKLVWKAIRKHRKVLKVEPLKEEMNLIEECDNPKHTPFEHEHCSKCNGSGNLPHYNHYAAGTCFKCKGAGSILTKHGKVDHAKWESARDKFTMHPAHEVKVGDAVQIHGAKWQTVKAIEHSRMKGASLTKLEPGESPHPSDDGKTAGYHMKPYDIESRSLHIGSAHYNMAHDTMVRSVSMDKFNDIPKKKDFVTTPKTKNIKEERKMKTFKELLEGRGRPRKNPLPDLEQRTEPEPDSEADQHIVVQAKKAADHKVGTDDEDGATPIRKASEHFHIKFAAGEHPVPKEHAEAWLSKYHAMKTPEGKSNMAAYSIKSHSHFMRAI